MFNVLTTDLSRGTVSAVFASIVVLSVQCVAARQASAATWYVPAGGDLQSALSRAQPGDEVVLQSELDSSASSGFPPRPPALSLLSDPKRRCRTVG